MQQGLVCLAAIGFLLTPTLVQADAGAGAGAGALGGALVGSLAGPAKNRVENSLIGAVTGGLLGYALGTEAENEGSYRVNQVLEVAPSYTTTTWVSPATSASYVVTPQPAQMVQGRICREVNIQASIDAKKENLVGLTCRDENGQWRLVDRNSQSVAPAMSMVPMATQTVTMIPAQTVVVNRPVTRYVVTEPYYYPSSSSLVIYKDWGGSRRHRNHWDHDWNRHRDHDWNRHRDHDWRHRH